MLNLTNKSRRPLPPGAEETLERVASAAMAAGGGPFPEAAQADVTLVGDDDMRELNRTYLGVDEPTDVISFSLLEGGPEPAVRGAPPPVLLGDVVISADQAFEQGEQYGHGFLPELALLVAHGVLHLLGHGDETPEERAEMRRMEREALAAAGLTVTLPGEHESGTT